MQQPNTSPQAQDIVATYELKEIAEMLIRRNNLHEGMYDLTLEFGLFVGAVGPSPSEVTPGVMVGVRHIGIMKTAKMGPSTVNAAEVNPPPAAKKATSKKT